MTSPARDPERLVPAGPGCPRSRSARAGGIVVDVHEGIARIAVIARRNRAGRIEWCLPKGHMENGETLPQAAAREVEEETGIEGRVLTELGTIDYWFATGQRRIHKFVHHYLLEATGGTSPSRTTLTTRPSTSPGCPCARPTSTSPSPTSDGSRDRPGRAWPGTGDAPRLRMPCARRGSPGAARVGNGPAPTRRPAPAAVTPPRRPAAQPPRSSSS